MNQEENKPKKSLPEILTQANSWLKYQTPKWTEDFGNLNLLVERPINAAELTLATHYLGLLYRSAANQGQNWRIEAFFKEFSVPIARVIAGIGYRKYEKGNFWDGFWDAISLTEKFEGDRFAGKSKAEISADWGKCFLAVLQQFNLPTFDGYSQKYVVPILIHSGIPISCLPNYFMAIDRGLNEVGFNAEAIVHYLVGDDSNHSYGINKPVLRFLEAGGEFALEFVDRSIDALAKLAREETLDSHPLPEDVLNAARKYFENQDEWGEQSRKGRSLKAGKVEVRLNLASGELNLLLPEIDTNEVNYEWEIGLDENFKTEKPRVNAGGNFTKRQSLSLTIERPVRRISIQASDGGVSRDLSLYDSNFPAIFFSIDGELIPRNVTLPKGIAYVLLAKDKTKGFDTEAPFVQQEISPLGWYEWELFRFDLTSISELSVFKDGMLKLIANKAKASIISHAFIEGLSLNGITVSTDRPQVKLPSGMNSSWQIEVRDMDDPSTKSILEVDGTDSEQIIDLFQESDLPIFGYYEISVRGPLGLGAAQKFVVIEDLEVDRPVGWRTLNNEGLSVHIADFDSKNFEIFPKITFLDQKTLEAEIVFSKNEKRLVCGYSPSTMSIAIRTSGIPQPWQYGPVNVDVEDLDHIELMIKVPNQFADFQLSLVAEGDPVQGISNSLKQNRQILSFELANLSTSIKLIREGDLYFDFSGLNLRVGRIRPRQVSTGVEATNQEIFLKNFSGGDVTLRIWSVNEAWRPWIDSKVPASGIVKIPDEFVGLGSLCVQWERVDPWSQSTLSDLPDASKLNFASTPSNPNLISKLGKQIESGNHFGSEKFTKVGHCWNAILLALRLNNPIYLDLIAIKKAAKPIADNPIHAIEVLAQQNLAQDEVLKTLVASGVLMFNLRKGQKSNLNDGDLTTRFKRSTISMIIPVINTAIQHDSPKHFPELWRQITLVFGGTFREISTSGIFTNPQAGGFASMEKILGQDPSKADYFVKLTGAYPREFLHVDSRMIAGLSLFKKRSNFENFNSLIPLERALLDIQHEFTTRMPFATKSILSRTSVGAEGWEALSALSLALAFLIRGQAHGMIQAESKCLKYEALLHSFIEQAPELFFADLSLVELAILAQDPDRRPHFDNVSLDGEAE